MELRTWLFKNVYHNPRLRENHKAAEVVVSLFEHFLEHPLEHPEERPVTGPDPLQQAVDFVAGMTDRYALAAYKRLFLPWGDRL